MLSKTHGQVASPTTLGKELLIFAHRLVYLVYDLGHIRFAAKLNGATGTFASMNTASKTLGIKVNWQKISMSFLDRYNFFVDNVSTQIEPHDWQVTFFNLIEHVNGVLHNLSTDMWLYISNKYFTQKVNLQEVGSSTMPHKINPINFENAEGNLEMSNAMLNGLAKSLVTSRLQRDLSDSTVQRNIGVALGYHLVAVKNLLAGLNKLSVNKKVIYDDLENSYEVLAEPLQSILRVLNVMGIKQIDDPYKVIKELTKGKRFDKNTFYQIADRLFEGVDKNIVNKIKKLTPHNYIGLAPQIVDDILSVQNELEKEYKEYVENHQS
jgi:adenylosuccinate lyase